MGIVALDHIQLAMPEGREHEARTFYAGVLGLSEQPKPRNLARRGGVWFALGGVKIHLGVEAGFRPALKAHPAFRVENLAELRARCEAAGFATVDDEPLPGHDRFYVADPFGNRIECLEPKGSAISAA
jgi:catechol 2,3-dioxygenase-like lactoylglutathione lyase family enzyme